MLVKDYCTLPTQHGKFFMYDSGDDNFHIVTFGDIQQQGNAPLVRIHSSCLASEVFSAQDCDCADQLNEAMKVMSHEGCGIIFHIQQEGRGQGLSKKIRAVSKMQTENLDTYDAFSQMGLAQDIREYPQVIAVLQQLQFTTIRLISNNPRKIKALTKAGFNVIQVHTHPKVRQENAGYLHSKNVRLDHNIPLEPQYDIQNDTSKIPATTHRPVLFYHSDLAWGELSNFSNHAIYLKGVVWPTVEHYYQAQKFAGSPVEAQIRECASPMQAKQLANEQSGMLWNETQTQRWQAKKETVMYEGLTAKFTQHPQLQVLLLSTGNRRIAEHTEHDHYWGDGINGTGSNRLGELLQQLRSALQANKKVQQPVASQHSE